VIKTILLSFIFALSLSALATDKEEPFSTASPSSLSYPHPSEADIKAVAQILLDLRQGKNFFEKPTKPRKERVIKLTRQDVIKELTVNNLSRKEIIEKYKVTSSALTKHISRAIKNNQLDPSYSKKK
jgi:hypothetical protein